MKAQKIGNSIMVTIPSDLAIKADIKVGDNLTPIFVEGYSEIRIKKDKVEKKRPASALIGNFKIPNFNYKQTLKDIKTGSYDR